MTFISKGGSQGKPETRSGPAREWRTRFAVTVLAGLVAMTGVCVAVAEAATTSEYQVKAAFLFHFAQFVEWPEERFKDVNSPITYCTIGDDPFQGELEAALKGKLIGERSFRVLHFKQPQQIQGCQVLFIGAEEKGAIPLITRYSLHDAREPGASLHILLAEDNAVNQRLASRLLEKRGALRCRSWKRARGVGGV